MNYSSQKPSTLACRLHKKPIDDPFLMSFDINWSELVSDESLNESIKEFLDNQFQSISLPSFIDNLSVSDFSLGNSPPEITIRHIGDPFDDFYEDEGDDDEKERKTFICSKESRKILIPVTTMRMTNTTETEVMIYQ